MTILENMTESDLLIARKLSNVDKSLSYNVLYLLNEVQCGANYTYKIANITTSAVSYLPVLYLRVLLREVNIKHNTLKHLLRGTKS